MVEKNDIPQRTFAEFFAGIGLMRKGLESHGWQIAFANDIDPLKEKMYRANFPDAEEHFLLGDIHKIPASKTPTVTLATASFPCNDLSLAGGREGLEGMHSSAFWGFIEILAGMGQRRPPLVLIENVVGFLTSHQGRDFETAMLALNDVGYAVDPFILDASWFVPQSRQRLFVVGRKLANVESKAAAPQFYESAVRPPALAEFIFSHPNIEWSIRSLPQPPKNHSLLPEILEDLSPDSPEWWSRERADYLLNQMSPRHRQIADKMIAGRSWSYGTVFRRVRNEKSMAELRTDGIAGCLRTPRGGSGRQILFKAGRGEYNARLLTPRECARLMGADDFKINVPLNQALFGFGDAVCVPAVSWIAQNYLNPLFDEALNPLPRLNGMRKAVNYRERRAKAAK
jgi:DNA (cytosine-5)-methyltransferase 1